MNEEIDRLRAALDAAETVNRDYRERLGRELAGHDATRQALRVYGIHNGRCDALRTTEFPCSCGLADLLG